MRSSVVRALRALASTAALALALPASAGDIYINGVRADGARDVSLSSVDVQIDANGDVYIHAPDYEIEVVDPSDGEPEPAAERAASPDAPPAPAGIWWLVSEDHASINQRVEVSIGGQIVATVQSGDPPIYLDLSEHLRVGSNAITFTPSADGALGGGALHVYVGAISQEGGDFQMPAPAIDYIRRSSSDPSDPPSTLSLDISVP